MENITNKTHVDVDDNFTIPAGIIENVFGDNIASVKYYDFSKANLNQENRIGAVSSIASICYANQKALGSISLYDRLACESASLPSSSFEFVPMLFNYKEVSNAYVISSDIVIENSNALKFGQKIEENGIEYLLTNFRAIVYDFEEYSIDLRDHFNTEAECEIIKKHFTVFNINIDMPTFGQMVRHRVNWQVLSRRYVSGSKVPFTFYISDQMKNVLSGAWHTLDGCEFDIMTEDVIKLCLEHYKAALAAGIKPQVARGIIPQCAYTNAWCAFQSKQLENFMKLRLKTSAQKEVRLVAEAMKKILGE